MSTDDASLSSGMRLQTSITLAAIGAIFGPANSFKSNNLRLFDFCFC